MKIVSFVAATSNSGKTTLIEKVVRILKERGLRVAVVKHAPKGFAVDSPGKDSWRFREAGADAVLLMGPEEMVLWRRSAGVTAEDAVRKYLGDADIVIREGFKREEGDRIEVFRGGVSGDHPLCMQDRSFIALVSDRPYACGIPRFDLDDARSVAEFLIAKL
jgi:molybdopterin-guanine dinucleotide biosynthesis protein B